MRLGCQPHVSSDSSDHSPVLAKPLHSVVTEYTLELIRDKLFLVRTSTLDETRCKDITVLSRLM